MSERSEQEAIFEWAKLMEGSYPELALLFAIPNGQVRPGQAVEPGLRPGVPDIFLPVPWHGLHGLFIELKCGRNTTTPEQRAWLDALADQGYQAVVARGADEAIQVISDYLGIEPG